MRVITGTARGMKLRTPTGMDTRPTTDQTKESMFNIIQFDIEGRQVLDLFAGTGQLGIEALSRGASGAVFADLRADCVKIIRENLQHTRFDGVSTVYQADYRTVLGRAQAESFGLIFLDPPYEGGMLEDAVRTIAQRDLLAWGGMIVCEGLRENNLPELAPPYYKGREYVYGKTRITLYIKRQVEEA